MAIKAACIARKNTINTQIKNNVCPKVVLQYFIHNHMYDICIQNNINTILYLYLCTQDKYGSEKSIKHEGYYYHCFI